MWVTSGDDGQMPLGVRVGRARKEGDEWRVDLTMHDGPVDFVRLAPPPDFAAPEIAPSLSGLPQPNNDRTLMTSAAPVATARQPRTAVSTTPPAATQTTPRTPPQTAAPRPATPARSWRARSSR